MKKRQSNGIFFIIYLLFWLGENCLSPYLGIYYKARGLNGIQIGVVSSVFSIAVLVAALLIGLVGDRLQKPKWLLCALCAGMVFSTWLLSQSQSYQWILFAVALYGFAYSPFNGITDEMLMSRLKETPSYFGRYRMGGTIGAGLGVLLAGAFMQKTNFKLLFGVYWLSALLCACFSLKLPQNVVETAAQEKTHWNDYLVILRHKKFIPIYLTMALWGFTEAGVIQFEALHVVACGYKSQYTSVLVATAMVGESLMFAFIPKISKKLKTKEIIAMAFFLQCARSASLALLFWLPLPVVIFFQFIGGGAYASLYSVMTQEISQTFPKKVSCSAQTLKLVVNRGIGMTCGSLMLGYFYEYSSLASSYAIFACTAGAFACFMLPKKEAKKMAA